MPPLRERERDIIDLSKHFLFKFSDNKKNLDQSAMTFLKGYNWPGNVRELENLFKRVCVLSSEQIISDDILIELIDTVKSDESGNNRKDIDEIGSSDNYSLDAYIEKFLNKLFESLEDEININLHDELISQIEKKLISKTLEYFSGNQIKSSKLLGINRNTLRSKIKKYKILNKSGKN